MSYTPTNWQDQLKDANGNIVQSGTSVTASRLNNIETGISNNTTTLGSITDGNGNITVTGTFNAGNTSSIGGVNTGSPRFARFDRNSGAIVLQLGNNSGTNQGFDVVDSAWSKVLFHAGNDGLVQTFSNMMDDGAGNMTVAGQINLPKNGQVFNFAPTTVNSHSDFSFTSYTGSNDMHSIAWSRNTNSSSAMIIYDNTADVTLFNVGTDKSVKSQNNIFDDGTGKMTVKGPLMIGTTDVGATLNTLQTNSSSSQATINNQVLMWMGV